MPDSAYHRLRPIRSPALRRTYALAALVVLICGGGAYVAAQQLAASGRSLQHAHAALEALQTLEIRCAHASNWLGARLISGDARFREDYRQALQGILPAIEAADAALAEDPEGRRALADFKQQVQGRIDRLPAPLAPDAAGGLPAPGDASRVPALGAPDLAVSTPLGALTQRYERAVKARRALDEQRVLPLQIALGLGLLCSLVLLRLSFLRTRRDLVRREQGERELERQRRFADTLIENAPMGVFIKEAQGLTLVRVNRFVEEITGRPREQMLGKDDGQFVGSEAAPALLQSEHDLVSRKQMQSVAELQIQTVRGCRTLRVRKVLLPDEHGEVRYLLGLSEDVTEQRRAERGQRQLAETLERKSRELEAANQELESFSYSVSHDLRAPLRAVEGYAAILEEDYRGTLDEEARRFLRSIREGATRMGHLIQDLLACSRLGRQPLAVTESDTRLLVEGVWADLRGAQPGIRAQLEILGVLPPSYGDPGLLQQVWSHLLENAAKFAGKVPDPRIQLRGETHGTEAVFSIQDNGVGFDMRYYDKLFKVFQRLHSETEDAGTGVGLAIVHRVIARHGGRVWAHSEPGQGACFSFALPLSPQAPGETVEERA